MAQFKVGDIVVLKSGGPKMTVTKATGILADKSEVQCSWFAGAKQEHGTFPIAALETAVPETTKK